MKQVLTFLTKSMQVLLLGILCIACSSSNDDGGGDNSTKPQTDVKGNVTVNLTPEKSKRQLNPMQGWVIYASIRGGDLPSDFWQKYDNFESSDGKVKVSDYATTLYMRGSWSDFNPRRGVYVWQANCDTEAAKNFRLLAKGAKERGLKLAFTFVVDSRDKHWNCTPDYVKDDGAKGYKTVTGSYTGWSPYPDDPVFQKDYAAFLTDFAKVFNDPKTTQFVSGFGLGKWGEGHTLIYSTGNDAPRQKVFDWITDLMSKLFTKVPIVINYHRCLLSTTDYTTSDLDFAGALISQAVNKGFSLRHDAFGMKHYYSDWERGIAQIYHFKVPIIMEGGWVEGSHGDAIKGDGYRNYAEVRQGEFSEGKGAHVNMMDLRYSSNVNAGETHSWFNSAFNLVKEFIADGGYRLYPDQVSVPKSISNGAKVTIVSRWNNLGWGYCPTNIPQWNQKYKVCFALLDKSTLKPVFKFVDNTPCLNEWIKDKPKEYSTSFTVSGVKAGEYTWAVGLVDTTDDNNIGIDISVLDSYKTSDGWVKLNNVSVK